MVSAALWTEDHLNKSEELIPVNPKCHICHAAIDTSDPLSFSICHPDNSVGQCEALTHLTCLSKRFLSAEASGSTSPPPLLPDRGTCPGCSSELRWGDIIRGCYRLHAHIEDGGKGRATRKRREKLRATKLEKLRRGELSSGSEAGSDAESGAPEASKPKKKAAAKPRAKKSALVQSDSDVPAEPKKRGRPKKALSGNTAAPKDKGKGRAVLSPISDSSDEAASTPALFLDAAELANYDALSDISDASEASDEERQLAYAAAADGSLEMQAGDISPDSSGTMHAVTSPVKRRKKEQPVDAPTSPEKKAKTASAKARGKAAKPVTFVEISDSD